MDNRDRDNYNDGRNEITDRERDRRISTNDRAHDNEMREATSTDYKHRDENRRLHFLNDLSDYKVASEDPDVRGWDVVDVNDRKVGKVDNLLVDIRKEKVRYLDVDLDQDMLHKDHDPLDNNDASGVHEYRKNGGDVHMIVPIGLARIDSSNKRVISDDINRSILEEGHTHRKGDNISTDYERNVVGCIRNCDDQTTSSVRSEDMGNTNRMGSSAVNSPTNETFDMRDSNRMGTTENREMRRPESSDDTSLSRSSNENERRTTETNPFSDDAARVSRDRNPSTLRDQPLDRRTGDEQNRGPIQDDFYNNRYFDDRRFFGR